MGEERAYLIKNDEFRPNEQVGPVVACCGLESSKLAKVPIIRSVFKKKDPSEKVEDIS